MQYLDCVGIKALLGACLHPLDLLTTVFKVQSDIRA